MRAMPFRTRAAEPTLAQFLARLAREERNLHRRQRLRRAVPWLCLAALAALGAALF